MTVAIIGGGIGGLSTAVALQHRGFDAHVYEAASELKPTGKGIWLPTNAMLVLDRLNLGDTVAAQGLALERLEICDKRAGVLQSVDLKAVYERFGRTTISILRSDLQTSLVAALKADTLHLGKRAEQITQGDESATVNFEDGEDVGADIVIGADGLRSRVRNAVTPDVPLRYAGQTCYLGVAELALPATAVRTVQEIWGGRARFGYSAVSEEKIYWFAPIKAPANSPMPEGVLETLKDTYNSFPQPVLDIIEHTAVDDIIRTDLYDFAPIEQWHKGRVVLVGDAAHAMTPNLGQGGAQAIEDAYALALALEQRGTPQAAFEYYETMRQAKAQKLVKLARMLGQVAHVTPYWLQSVRNIGLRAVPEQMNQRQAEALYALTF